MGNISEPNVGETYQGTIEGCTIAGYFKDCDFSSLNMHGVTVAGTFVGCKFESDTALREDVYWVGTFEDCSGVGV